MKKISLAITILGIAITLIFCNRASISNFLNTPTNDAGWAYVAHQVSNKNIQ